MLILLLVGGFSPTAGSLAAAAEVATLHPRQRDFSTWRFGLFLHFDVSTFADREWSNGHEDPALFAPAKLDCGQWADSLARCLAQLELHRLQPSARLLRPAQRALDFMTRHDGALLTGSAGQCGIWNDDQDARAKPGVSP